MIDSEFGELAIGGKLVFRCRLIDGGKAVSGGVIDKRLAGLGDDAGSGVSDLVAGAGNEAKSIAEGEFGRPVCIGSDSGVGGFGELEVAPEVGAVNIWVRVDQGNAAPNAQPFALDWGSLTGPSAMSLSSRSGISSESSRVPPQT